MAEWDRDTPWRQGHLLCKDAIAALGFSDGEPERALAIVATHDCDLAQVPKWEPRIEIITGRLLTDRDGNCTHAKNPRQLHVQFSGDPDFWAEFEATGKTTIDKVVLSEYRPRTDARLTPENHAIFQMWLASRYRRSAFPDEFEQRLKSKAHKLNEKISKAVRPHGELITGVFFDVDGGVETTRDGPDDTYVLDILILHSAEPDFEAAENAAQVAADDIEKAFRQKLFDPTGAWQHIELRSCEVVSESVLTYLQFRQLKRWRLDHLSFAANPPHAVVAE